MYYISFHHFWFTPSFEMGGEAGRLGVSEQGICEAANPPLTWAADAASRGAAWTWQPEDLFLLPLALVLLWCPDVYERPAGAKRVKEPGDIALSLLEYAGAVWKQQLVPWLHLCPHLQLSLSAVFLNRAGWEILNFSSALPSSSTSQTNLPTEFICKSRPFYRGICVYAVTAKM